MPNTVEINKSGNFLSIQVETEHLVVRSTTGADEKDYLALVTDAKNMKTFGTGQPLDPGLTKERLKYRIAAWANNEPFNLYAILEKESGKFIGFFCFTRQENSNDIEIAYVIDYRYQSKGYGREMMTAIFESLIPKLAAQGYEANKLIATTLKSNIASQNMLRKVRFVQGQDKVAHGDSRFSFSMPYALFGQQIQRTEKQITAAPTLQSKL